MSDLGDTVQSITLQQVWLGAAPYALIEIREASDGSGDPSLFLSVGGGAEDKPLYLPLFALTESDATENNPVAVMLRELADSGEHDVDTLAAVVDQFNDSWKPFVFRS